MILPVIRHRDAVQLFNNTFICSAFYWIDKRQFT
uniref:Bm13516 n=1 Tax=Brugia malayi TaxID=6279 RepID=A0A1I9G3R8_BRUMA|nr:Bm13516 [Brugia malayi]